MSKTPSVAIVGGGAAGLFCAAMLARETGGRLPVTVLEKGARVGRKLLATGNGTCNITNLHAAPSHYHGEQPSFVRPALQAFSPQQAMAFFEEIGVVCTARENGRVYPLCEQASAVLDCLRTECTVRGVREVCDTAVTALSPTKEGWRLNTPAGPRCATCVVVACGGAASPSLGGGSDGYTLLGDLGYRKVPLAAAIVPITVKSDFLRAVKGLRAQVRLSLTANGGETRSAEGELLFTDYGLSGPVAFQLSHMVGQWERRKNGKITAGVDLLPDWSSARLTDELRRRAALPGRTVENWLTGLLNKRIGQTVCRAAGLSLVDTAAALSADAIRRVAALIRDWRFEVCGTKGLSAAQVTAGGIRVSDFDPRTMQSVRHAGLYAVGEVLDIDGDCGGYNLQWAWSSGYLAGQLRT